MWANSKAREPELKITRNELELRYADRWWRQCEHDNEIIMKALDVVLV